jgi:hypothetical protein
MAFSVATFINRTRLERISDFIRVLTYSRIAAFRQYEIRAGSRSLCLFEV